MGSDQAGVDRDHPDLVGRPSRPQRADVGGQTPPPRRYQAPASSSWGMPGISRLITATRRSSMSTSRGGNDKKRGSIIRPMPRSALVLSGGGLLGVGWELGVMRGLQDGGVAMGSFDLVVGTSAGAASGAIAASGAV